MRNILLSGAAALALALAAIDADAAPSGGSAAYGAAVHHQRGAVATAPSLEGAAIAEEFSARLAMGDHAHDPAFSRQQDEIYEGRF